MHSREYIDKQIKEMNIPDGAIVLMHTSLRAIGKIDGGAEVLLDLLVENITSRGGVFCVPTHTWDNLFLECDTLDLGKKESCLGAFPNIALADSRGIRSCNPTHSIVAFGDEKRINELIKDELFIDTPTAPNSFYGKLCQPNAYVLLVGVGQNSNTYLHSVEEMLDFPNRMVDERTPVSVRYSDGRVEHRSMRMFDESVHGDVSEKFYRYEPAFRHFDAIEDFRIGDAAVQLCSTVRIKEAMTVMTNRSELRDPLAHGDVIPECLYL